MQRGPGRPKEFDRRVDTRLTDLQLLHLRLRSAAGNQSVAAVLRELISADLRRRLLQEVASGRTEGNPEGAS
jgi:hypothetical protein